MSFSKRKQFGNAMQQVVDKRQALFTSTLAVGVLFWDNFGVGCLTIAQRTPAFVVTRSCSEVLKTTSFHGQGLRCSLKLGISIKSGSAKP